VTKNTSVDTGPIGPVRQFPRLHMGADRLSGVKRPAEPRRASTGSGCIADSERTAAVWVKNLPHPAPQKFIKFIKFIKFRP
jgi:hypothetical protein